MRTKERTFIAHVVRVEHWHQEIEIPAESRGDARVIAERLGKEPGAWALGDSAVQVERLEEIQCEIIHRRIHRGGAESAERFLNNNGRPRP